MEFKMNLKKYLETLESAIKHNNYRDMVAVVTLNIFENNIFYGFHFERPEAVREGDIQTLNLDHVRRIETVLNDRDALLGHYGGKYKQKIDAESKNNKKNPHGS